MTTVNPPAARKFDVFCAPEFSKILEKEIARLERGEPAYTDREIGNMLGRTKDEIYAFRRRQRIPDATHRMAGYCKDILAQANFVNLDARKLNGECKNLRELVKVNKRLRFFDKLEWFFIGLSAAFIGFFAVIFIFGERAAS